MPTYTETHTYKVVGDCEIKADLHRLDDSLLRPVIVWIHGGALMSGQRSNLSPRQRESYVGAGYVVASMDYRLAPETKLDGIVEDLQDAFTWLREEGPDLFGIDGARVGVVGHSAGGYLTLMSGFRVEPRPNALVSFYGYGDIAGPWYSRPDPFYSRLTPVPKEEAYAAVGSKVISEPLASQNRGRFYLYCRQQGLWPREVAGHDPDAEPEAFDPLCPDRNVSKDYPPTLLLHGDQDTDVPYQLSVTMGERLAAAGVEHELITIPGGGHGFDGSDAPIVADAFERVLAFLNSHLA